MNLIFLFFFGLAEVFFVDERDSESYYLAHATMYGDEIATFFKKKTQDELEKLMLNEQPRISVFASWIFFQRECMKTDDKDRILGYRSEFLGFITGKLNILPPTWWKEAIRSYAVTDTHDVVEWELPITYPAGYHVIDRIACANNIIPKTIETDYIQFDEGGTEVTLRLKGILDDDDWFFAVDDLPNALTTLVLSDQRRIVGVASELGDLNLFCVTKNGTKLWHALVSYRVDNEGARPNVDVSFQLIDVVTTKNQVAVFWVCRQAISLTLLDINTGAEILRFSTRVHFQN